MNEFLELTVITMRLKEEATDNLKKSITKGFGGNKPSKDSYGRDAEFYRDLGIDPPDEIEDGFDEEEAFSVNEEDIEIVESPGAFRLDSLMFFVAGEKEGSTIYLDIDYKASVKETVEEIKAKINKLSKKSKDGVK
jgi:hypothetical protein